MGGREPQGLSRDNIVGNGREDGKSAGENKKWGMEDGKAKMEELWIVPGEKDGDRKGVVKRELGRKDN